MPLNTGDALSGVEFVSSENYGPAPDWAKPSQSSGSVSLDRRTRQIETYGLGRDTPNPAPVIVIPALNGTLGGQRIYDQSPPFFVSLRDSFVNRIQVIVGMQSGLTSMFAVRLQMSNNRWSSLDPVLFFNNDTSLSWQVMPFKMDVFCAVYGFAFYADATDAAGIYSTLIFS